MLSVVRFQVLTSANVKMAVFWDVASCSLIKIHRRFRGEYCLHNQGGNKPHEKSRLGPECLYIWNYFFACGLLISLMMAAVSISETSVNFYQTKRRNVPEDSYLHVNCEWHYLRIVGGDLSFNHMVTVRNSRVGIHKLQQCEKCWEKYL